MEITEAMAKENKMTLSKNIEVAAGFRHKDTRSYCVQFTEAVIDKIYASVIPKFKSGG